MGQHIIWDFTFMVEADSLTSILLGIQQLKENQCFKVKINKVDWWLKLVDDSLGAVL